MPWSLVTSANAAGTNAATTAARNCTGADLIVLCASHYIGGSNTFSDSSSNTWTTVTQQAGAPDTNNKTDLAYCLAPTTTSSQTFTYSNASTFIGLVALVLTQGSAPTFVTRVGAAYASGNVLKAGSLGNANDLVVAVIGYDGTAPNGTLAIDSGFSTIVTQTYGPGNNEGVAAAWLQVSGAVDPQWSWTGSASLGALSVSFTGTGGGATTWGPLLGLQTNRLVVGS